jgi:hypothetical protein
MLCISLCFGQTYSAITPDATIIQFLKWEVKNGKKFSGDNNLRFQKKTSIFITEYNSINFICPDSLSKTDYQYYDYLYSRHNDVDSLFNQSERDYFLEQIKGIKDTSWNHKIPGANIKKWKSPKDVYTYSIPLFSTNGKYVMIKKSFYCGNVCAYGGIYLYRKVNSNNWELVKVLNGWMS